MNNTVYQVTGTALRIEPAAQNTRLRNNILVVESGYGIDFAGNGQAGFESDYNLIRATGAGRVGYWQGLDRPTLAAWQLATFTDGNSLAQDALFVAPRGADGRLGYYDTTSDGRDDDFHLQSPFGSFHGGSLAPVLSAASGLPAMLAATLVVDATQSPAIDRGAAVDSYALEPVPHGGFVNLGAYGNTPQASLSPTQYLTVLRPNGGETWLANQTFAIRWRSHDSLGTVDIELLQDGTADPVLTIAADTPNDGEFFWTVPASIPPGSNYRLRVVRQDLPAVVDASDTLFTLGSAVRRLLRERWHG